MKPGRSISLNVTLNNYEAIFYTFSDPCDSTQHIVFVDKKGLYSARSTIADRDAKCMRHIPETWYRIMSPAGDGIQNADIHTECVEPLSCSTRFPIGSKGWH